MRREIILLGLALLLLIPGACGDDAGTSTSASASATTSASTSGGPSASILESCDKYCDARAAAGCEPSGECTSSCTESAAVSTFCDSSFAESSDCYAEEITATGQCDPGMASECSDENDAWLMCVFKMGCSELSGSGSPDNCTQEGTCDGVMYRAECGATTCNCFKANALAGTCNVNDDDCNIRKGCCGSLFFP
jgi:hypothetical protein